MENQMENAALQKENWKVLISLFPENWERLAEHTHAIGRLRGFRSAEALIRTLLIHIAHGYSLRETAVRARESGLANISDVALLKRLRSAEHWFKALCHELLKEFSVKFPIEEEGINMRLVDGTIVKEPGQTGSQWRIHYSLRVPCLSCDYFELTGVEGSGTGESFKKFPLVKNDCLIGDRGFSTIQGLAYVSDCKAYSLCRLNTSSLSFYTQDDREFNLLKQVKKIKEAGEPYQWEVKIKNKNEGLSVNGRLCVLRKSEEAAKRALEKIKRKANKTGVKVKPETIECAKYIIVFTTLPKEKFSTLKVLEWYRVRWQIELLFKRLKSLAAFGHLPKYDDQSSRAWLYGKLFIGLLTEKLMRHASAISPWGYCLSEK